MQSSSELRGNTELTLIENFNNESLDDSHQIEEQKITDVNRLAVNTNEEFKEEIKANPLTPKFNKFRFAQMRYSAHNCRKLVATQRTYQGPFQTIEFMRNKTQNSMSKNIIKISAGSQENRNEIGSIKEL